MREEKAKNKSYKFIFWVLLAFFVVQAGMILFAGFYFKNILRSGDNSICGAGNSATYNQFYRLDERLSQIQSELNYLRGYILSKNQ